MAAASPSSSMIIVDYELKSRIGGDRSPSSIWRAIDRSNGQDVILKKIPLAGLTRNLRDSLYFELNFLANVLHPSIVPLLDVLKVDGYVFLVLEFCEGGDLAAFVKRNGRLRESVVGRFMAQLGEGLEVLQAHHIIHRDLKPENILLSTPSSDPVLKIADFGLSRNLYSFSVETPFISNQDDFCIPRVVCPGEFADTVCGSPLYMAPEALQFGKYNNKADMWSIGAICFELLNGHPPFHGRNNVQLPQNIKKSISLPFSQQILASLNSESVDMCSMLSCKNPVYRLSFDEFYQHKFFRR